MFYYILAVVFTIILFLGIQYYINNYGSERQINTLNTDNNKTYLFIGILLFCGGCVYIYTSNISKNVQIIDTPITTNKASLHTYETDFINSIKNQEVEVGSVPF